MLESYLLLGALLTPALAYLLRVLLFEAETRGPFESKTDFVLVNGVVVRPVNLFDRIRRLFGTYRVSKSDGLGKWDIYVPRMLLWLCPKCLSFWLVSPAAIGLTVWMCMDDLRYGLLYPVIHLALAFSVQALVFLNLKLEGDDGSVSEM